MLKALLIAMFLIPFCGALPASSICAGEPDTTASRHPEDCRFESGTGVPGAAGRMSGVLLPQYDLFRPLMADMKQPRFYMSYRRVRFQGTALPAEQQGNDINAGVVGFGGNFGIWARRQRGGCNGIQINLHAGVFSQFNLSKSSVDLINSDFVVGLPLTLRHGRLSARMRLFHQSSHLGDEFLLHNPEVSRVDISFEAYDMLLSVEGGWWRFYGGGGRLLHHTTDLRPGSAQWGFELCGSGWSWTLLRQARMKPVLAADFKTFEERDWGVTLSSKGGVEMKSLIGPQRFRFLLVYLRGFVPFGQFFNTENIDNFGMEIQLDI